MGVMSAPTDSSATFAVKTILVFAVGVFTIAAHGGGGKSETSETKAAPAKPRIVLPPPFGKVAPKGAKTSADFGLMATGDCEFVVPDVPAYVDGLQLGGSHVTGQFLGAQALMQAGSIENLTKTFLPRIHHNAMIKHIFASHIGLYHASVWIITGVVEMPFSMVTTHLRRKTRLGPATLA